MNRLKHRQLPRPPLTPSPRPGPPASGGSGCTGGAGNECWRCKPQPQTAPDPSFLLAGTNLGQVDTGLPNLAISCQCLFNKKRADSGFSTFGINRVTSVSEPDTGFPLSTEIRKSPFSINA